MKALSIIITAILIAGCASQRPVSTAPTAPDPSRGYQLPANYAAHRAQQSAFETKLGSIAYYDSGTRKPAIVLLHGVPTSSWMYRKMIPLLERDFRVIAPDFLGYGGSDKPESTGSNYSTAAQAANIALLLRKLAIDRYQLLFHDMGGLVGWRLLSRDIRSGAHRIRGFTALNTIIAKEGFNHPKMKPGLATRSITKAYTRRAVGNAILGGTFKSMGLTQSIKLSKEECLGYALPLRDGSDQALYDFFTGMDDDRFARLEDDLSALKGFKGRALVLWGMKDKILTAEQFPALFEQHPVHGKHVIRYVFQSHFLAEEIPGRLVDEIRTRFR